MFGWFTKVALPPPDDIEWILETFEWLIREHGGFVAFETTPLVLPTPEYFAITEVETHARAQAIFARMLDLTGLTGWPFELEAQRAPPTIKDVMPGYAFGSGPPEPKSPAGTFRVTPENRIRVTYAPSEMQHPPDFVATMAHEIGHALVGTAATPPPDGWDLHEPATDVAAHYLGFGVFAANTVVRLRKTQDNTTYGWQVSRVGYLSEAAHSYALAVFMAPCQIPFATAKPHLAPNPRAFVKRALADLDARYRDRLERIRRIEAPEAAEAPEATEAAEAAEAAEAEAHAQDAATPTAT